MQFPDDQIEELKQLCPGARQYEEGGIPYFFLPQLHLPDECSPVQLDALLCPTAHHGYTSRLFFEQVISSRQSRNWSTTVRIMERNWHAISWQIPQTNLRLAQMVGVHLRAFR
jgi:hypothetical protein